MIAKDMYCVFSNLLRNTAICGNVMNNGLLSSCLYPMKYFASVSLFLPKVNSSEFDIYID